MSQHCQFCGSVMEAGALFCGECGKRQNPQAAAPPPPPANPYGFSAQPQFPAGATPAHPAVPPPLAQPAYGAGPVPAYATAPQRVQGQGAMFEILRHEMYQMVKITLANSAVTIEAGQMHYMIGNIQLNVQGPSVGGLAKSFLTKEKAVRPVYQGTGEIYLTPTFGECNFLELNGEEWVLDKGCYLASDMGIEVGMFTNKAISGLFGGEGLFQTKVSGRGQVVYWSQGPVQRVDLQGQTLVVDGSFAVARSASLNYRVEKAAKGFLGGMMSGEGLVNTFQGYGTVMLAPIPNRYMSVMSEFGGLYSAIRNIRSS